MNPEPSTADSKMFVPNPSGTATDYTAAFKETVLKHIQQSLGTHEWVRLRAMADNRRRFIHYSLKAEMGATAEQLLDAGLSEDGISVQETLVPAFKATAVEIGKIEDQPVYYVVGQGVYLWGLEPVGGNTLTFWVTYPAYPPSW